MGCFQCIMNEQSDGGSMVNITSSDELFSVKGIVNNSQTCYLNSSLQLLLACKNLMHRVLEVNVSPGLDFIRELNNIVVKWFTKSSPLNLELEKQRIVDIICRRYDSQIIYGEQQDAHEVLLHIFRMIRDDFELANIEGNAVWTVSDLVEVVSRRRISCNHCDLSGQVTETKQPMLDVTVNGSINLQTIVTNTVTTSSSIQCVCGRGMLAVFVEVC